MIDVKFLQAILGAMSDLKEGVDCVGYALGDANRRSGELLNAVQEIGRNTGRIADALEALDVHAQDHGRRIAEAIDTAGKRNVQFR